jgi:urease subunit alpha
VQPIISRQSSVSPEASITFVSQESMKWEVNELFQLKKRVMGVYNVTGISKKDMKFNDMAPNVEIDPDTYTVRVDGQVINSASAETLPLSKGYFMF